MPSEVDSREDVIAFAAGAGVVVLLKVSVGKAADRRRLNSISQCCSSVSPTILVERRVLRSLYRR